MACVLKFVILLQARFVLQASAVRADDLDTFLRQDRVAEPQLKSLLRNAPEAICGGVDIWAWIAQDRSLHSIQNIKWEKIYQTGLEFIVAQKGKVETLEVDLTGLAERIAQKQKQDALQETSAEQIGAMIDEAMTSEESFQSLETAQRTLCGVPTFRPRAPRNAYKNSTVAFQKAVEAFFEQGGYVLEGNTFKTVCGEKLPCGDNKDCYCGSLCQTYRDIAQEVSDLKVGAKNSDDLDKLLREQSTKQSDLKHHKLQLDQCEEDLSSIKAFGEQIKDLKADMQEKGEKVMDAEWALQDAMASAEDLKDQLLLEEKNTQDAIQLFTDAGDDFEEAKVAFEKVQADEAELEDAQQANMEALEKARLKLDNAKSAEVAVAKLKMAVAAIMIKMSHFFKEAVQQPVEFIGFEAELDVFEEGRFHEDPWNTTSTPVSVLTDSVKSMHALCESEQTKVQFAQVASRLDLSPLCSFEEPQAVEEDLKAAVTNVWTSVIDEVRDVISWLQPFKGQPELTDEKHQEYMSAGEPEAFREIAGVYHDAAFFNYLKDWKAGGPFLELLRKLQATVGDLTDSVAALVAEQKDLEEKSTKLDQAREQAKLKFAEAQEKRTVTAEAKEAMEAKVAELEDQSMKLKEQETELRQKLAEAQRLYELAKETLVASHTKATSMLQAYQALGRDEQDAWELLDVRRADARERVRRLERLLAAAKRSERASATRLHRS